MVVARGRVVAGVAMGRCWSKGTKYQLCKMNKFWRASVQHSDRLKFAKKVCSHHTHKNFSYKDNSINLN